MKNEQEGLDSYLTRIKGDRNERGELRGKGESFN